jgi:hypothetical protein
MPMKDRDVDVRASEAVISNPLMREEVRRAAEQAQTADTYRTMSGYLHWVTTIALGAASYLGGVALGLITNPITATTGLLASPLLMPIAAITMGVISIGTLAANIHLSRKATNIEQYNEVLRSDIDSQNQAHRMVQAFARAQTQGTVQADNATPMTSTAPSFVERYGQRTQQHGSWQERELAKAAQADVQAMQALRG